MNELENSQPEWTRLQALESAAEIFLAVVGDGNVMDLLDYLQGIFQDALEIPE